MSDSYKICPICGSPALRQADVCTNCGTSLENVAPINAIQRPKASKSYDYRYGEDDLLESSSRSRRSVALFTGMLTLAIVACIGGLIVGALTLIERAQPTPTPSPAPTVDAAATQVIITTNTPAPSPIMRTVTPPPPTPTMTETPGPCIREVRAGDDLISMAWDCGHRSLDVVPIILATNDLAAPELIQVGQQIIIPLPTPTDDPNAATPVPTEEAAAGDLVVAALPLLDDVTSDPNATPAFVTATPLDVASDATPTLLPGIGWHTVQTNESMAGIASRYNTSAEVLAQLNPEIVFSQCDFGEAYGGPRCTVLLVVGQQIRVPVPTPTPSHTPTLTGSETATPTATPTHNAPNLLNPPDRILFRADELITLRWVATGSLDVNQVYRVTVEDLTANRTYTGDTDSLTFIVPTDWQGRDGVRHDYRWSVSVINLDHPNNPIYTTPTRLFSWESRGERN